MDKRERLEKVYYGWRDKDDELEVHIRVKSGLVAEDDQPLRHFVKHSPTGFEFGYGGSGPHDTALSILVDFLEGDQYIAEKLYCKFCDKFIACLPRKEKWFIDGYEIDMWLDQELRK